VTTLKVRKIGNSLGTILPADVAAELKVREGDSLYVVSDGQGGVRLTPYDPQFAAAMEAFEEGRRAYRNALRELSK
jgi:putative addiction module antidote